MKEIIIIAMMVVSIIFLGLAIVNYQKTEANISEIKKNLEIVRRNNNTKKYPPDSERRIGMIDKYTVGNDLWVSRVFIDNSGWEWTCAVEHLRTGEKRWTDDSDPRCERYSSIYLSKPIDAD